MATFTFEVAGTGPFTYQWYQDTAGDGVFTEMVGETAITLTVPDISTNVYYATVTNDCGTAQTDTVRLETPTPGYACDAWVNELTVQGFDELVFRSADSTWEWTEVMADTWDPGRSDPTSQVRTKPAYYFWYISGPSDCNSDWGSSSGLQKRNPFTQWTGRDALGQLEFCDGPVYYLAMHEGNSSVTSMQLPRDWGEQHQDYSCAILLTGPGDNSTWNSEILRNTGQYYRVIDSSGPVSGGQFGPYMIISAIASTVTGKAIRISVGSDGDDGGESPPNIGRVTEDIELGDLGHTEWVMMSVSVTNATPVVSSAQEYLYCETTVEYNVTLQNGTVLTGTLTGSNIRGASNATDLVVGYEEYPHDFYSPPTPFGSGTDGKFISFCSVAYKTGAQDTANLAAISSAFQRNFIDYTP